MAREDFSFVHTLRVRWSEVDMQGIVFNGNYLNYFDVAFTEYWRATGLPDVIAQSEAGVEYHAPSRFDDLLEIGVRCAELGRSSLRFVLEIHRGGEHLISGEVLYVHANSRLLKSEPVPAVWRDVLTGFEKAHAVLT